MRQQNSGLACGEDGRYCYGLVEVTGQKQTCNRLEARFGQIGSTLLTDYEQTCLRIPCSPALGCPAWDAVPGI